MYTILPALIPDVEKIYDIYFKAFKNDKMGEIMVDILFPDGTDSAEFRKAHATATIDWWHHCAVQYTYKCVDTETGEIVGMALGDCLIQGRTEEERTYKSVPWLQGAQKERADAILRPLHEAREKLFGGRPHICEYNTSPSATLHPSHGSFGRCPRYCSRPEAPRTRRRRCLVPVGNAARRQCGLATVL